MQKHNSDDQKQEFQSLGTHITCYFQSEDASILEELKYICEHLDNAYSRFKKGNELNRLNHCKNKFQEVTPELLYLLKKALEAYDMTNGIFDIRVKKALEGLGYDDRYSFAEDPSYHPAEFASNVSKNSPLHILGDTVMISEDVELGGLGKGYAVELMKNALLRMNVKDFCINAGGDIYAQGATTKKVPFKIYFENPFKEGEVIGEVDVDGFSVATSGVTQRSWGEHHHIIDPRTGLSARGTRAAIVQATSPLTADIYSTALFVMGLSEAKKWHLQNRGLLEFAIINESGEIFRTESFKGKFYS